MAEDATLLRLREILLENATDPLDPEKVTRETSFEELGIDSLSILDLLYDVDQVFEIQLEASEVVDLTTVGEFVALLEKRQAEAG